MAEDSGQEKTEEATPRRRQDAHDEGNVPRSAELTTAVLLLGTALVLNVAGVSLAESMVGVFGSGLAHVGTVAVDAGSSVALLRELGMRALPALAWFLLAMTGLAFSISAVQARGVLSLKPLGPNWDRLNPAKNAKRMFGPQTAMELLKSLAKLAIVGSVVYTSLRSALPEIVALAQESPFALLNVTRHYALRLLTMAGLSYLALAVVDYAYQIWQHEQGMKMSREDIKQELRSSEGDPQLKQRVRAIARSRMRRQMMKDVPRADVVIANPTHIAIALLYDPDNFPAPVVLAMGERKVAERIKAIAFESGVPVIENKPLARALLATARVGTMIPAELYLAVAEILAFVIKQRVLAPSRWRGTRTV